MVCCGNYSGQLQQDDGNLNRSVRNFAQLCTVPPWATLKEANLILGTSYSQKQYQLSRQDCHSHFKPISSFPVLEELS